MIDGKKVLALILARGGSKGVPRKNLRLVGNKPLIAWTIEEAKKSTYIDRLVLSTEDEEIIKVATKWGCEVPFKRPLELAQDNSKSMDVIKHALNNLPNYDYVVLLQPTSPLRTVVDIDNCIENCIGHNAKACVSITEPDKSPYWMYSIDDKKQMTPIIKATNKTQRQELPSVFALNGAVYAAETQWLVRTETFLTDETIGYIMPRERSFDIDTELDLKICDLLLKDNETKGLE